MNIEQEIIRLLDIMPASGRMLTKIVSKPQQLQVIEIQFPLPWKQGSRPIYINFELWRRLSRQQRDLLLLRAVTGLTGIKWFKPDIYQGIALAGIIGLTVELVQTDPVGIVVAGGLSAIALRQVWQKNKSVQKELDADETAIKIATRRGYSETEAASHLLSGMETVAKLEGRSSLNFTELIRSQNLKAIANISSVGVPSSIREN